MLIPNQNLECIIIESKKPKSDTGKTIAQLSIISAAFIICLNFVHLIYAKRGFYLTEIITIVGTTAAVSAGLAAGAAALIIGGYQKRKSIIHLALAGLLLNGVMIAMGFVKNPLLGKLQSDTKTVILPSGHKIITEDWVMDIRETKHENVILLSDDDFDKTVNHSSGVVLVYFRESSSASSCMMMPVIESIAGQHQDKARFYKVYAGKSPQTSNKFSIKKLPVIILFKNGNECERWTGFTESSEINAALTKRLNQ